MTANTSVDLSLSMPSSDFLQLVGRLDNEPRVPATSLVRRFQAANTTMPATHEELDPEAALKRLPNDAVGFCTPRLHSNSALRLMPVHYPGFP